MAYIREYRGKWRAEVQKHGQRISKLADTEDQARLWAEHIEANLDSHAKRWKPQLVQNGPRLVTMIPRIVLDAARLVPHSQADVIQAAIPTDMASGVYFLLRGTEVVYVGQSLDVLGRISRHRREGRKFDSFSYMECPAEELDRLETLYIKAFVPEGNVSLGNRPKPSAGACPR